MPEPILVVGLNRSGTKWLSNILCNHPQIAGVQSKRARGILETNLFHRMQEKFDLRSGDDYVGFVELWKKTEFFQVTGEDAEYLYSLDPRPLSFVRIFELVMQRFAIRRSARFWLQKCDPERALGIGLKLSNVRVVAIRRDTLATAQSMKQLNVNTGRSFSLLKSLPGQVRSERLLKRVEQRFDCITIDYDELRSDPAAATRSVCKQLSIDFEESLLEVKFEPNTSFQSSKRPAPIAGLQRWLATLIILASSLAPMWVLNRLLARKKRDEPPLKLVAGTFGDLKDHVADGKDYFT
ncbi:MAG: sulfotransferase [Pseudomonadota bacterium]